MRFSTQRIVFLYVVVSIFWLIISDYLVEMLAFVTALDSHVLQTGKGVFFVLVTGVLLHLLIKRQQRILIDYGNQYRRLFHSNPNPLWIYDRETLKFVDVNDAAIRNYGYSRKEFAQMIILDIRPVEDIPKARESARNFPHHYFASGIHRHKKKNGQLLMVSITGNIIQFNGRDCTLIMARDITTQLQLDEKLKRSYKVEKELREELEKNMELLKISLEETRKREYRINEQNEVLRKHSWANSHAIRKPLTSIMGLISLSKTAEDEAEIKELHSLIEVASEELDAIIKSIARDINAYEMKREI